MSRRAPFCALLALAASVSGCATAAPSAPRFVGSSPPVLTARVRAAGSGCVGLRVAREWTREMEQEASFPQEVQVADADVTGQSAPYIRRVHANIYYGDPDSRGRALGEALGRALAETPVRAWAAALADLVRLLFSWAIPAPSPPPMVRFVESFSEPSLSATIEPAGGGEAVDLGIQPLDGYVLTGDVMARLGGYDATVVVRDGILSATIRLPAPP